MKILNAIIQLLKFKGFATISEVAEIAGVKKVAALECFNNNRDLICVDKKGRITKIDTWIREVNKQNELYASGKLFKNSKINNTYTKLHWQNNEEADKLKHKCCIDGPMDCYQVRTLFDTPENRKKLEDLGMIFYEDLHKDYDAIEKCWKE